MLIIPPRYLGICKPGTHAANTDTVAAPRSTRTAELARIAQRVDELRNDKHAQDVARAIGHRRAARFLREQGHFLAAAVLDQEAENLDPPIPAPLEGDDALAEGGISDTIVVDGPTELSADAPNLPRRAVGHGK